MAVLYLEPDDEITGAVTRLRAMSDTQVVLVVPAGSRIGTSRINFRLLAREASRRKLYLAAVSDDPPVRAMAAAAGLAAFASVEAAETALLERASGSSSRQGAPPLTPEAGPSRSPDRAPASARTARAQRPGRASPRSTPAGERSDDRKTTRDDETQLLRVPTQSEPPVLRRAIEQPAARPAFEPPLYQPEGVARSRRRRASRLLAPLIAVVLLLTLVGLGAYAAYLFLPTAEITLRPRLSEVGPVSVTITADPSVAVVDADAGLVPAQRLEIPISASGEFSATGTRVTATSATGTVRFRSENTLLEVPVPAGTIVSTADGVEFETTASVTVPRAVFNESAGTVNVAVRAIRPGPRGNVAAGTITRLSEQLSGLLISVRNPQPTTGGRRTEVTVVTQEDYDAAVTQLSGELTPRLSAALADPATTPRGLTVYRLSARLGAPVADRQPSALVDQPTESFMLTMSAVATVLAVNEQLIDDVAAQQLRRHVPPGATMLEATVTATHPPGVVRGGVIEFAASGVGQAYFVPDRDQLLAQIRGQPVAEARAIMERYGSVDIVIWPDFIDRVPDQLARINLVVQPPAESP